MSVQSAETTAQLDAVRAIIRERRITTFFQPIISIRQRSTVLTEALSRPVAASSEPALSVAALFSGAARAGLTLELDRLCREKALQAFAARQPPTPDLLLSLNFESSTIETGVVGSDYLYRQVLEAGLKPAQVVIEIVESRIADAAALLRFLDRYRSLGFLIALDDFGAGHSNLERIPLIKPDIIKVDRGLITAVDQEYHKAEVLKALYGLAHQIGALAIAEGVEREAELAVALACGFDLFQGFYFARPEPAAGGGSLEAHPARLARGAELLREIVARKAELQREIRRHYAGVIADLAQELEGLPEEDFSARLGGLAARSPDLQCLYVLDWQGRQLSDTVFNSQSATTARSGIFQPARPGADQSLKEYFMQLGDGREQHLTEPYLSRATGRLCVTASRWFLACNGERQVLCCDFILPENEASVPVD